MRLLALVTSALLLAACGSETERVESPRASIETFDRATVVQTADRTVLCEGAIAESAPPQCDGPTIDGWDWAAVIANGEQGARWGDFCFEASRAGGTVVLTSDPRPVGTCGQVEYTGAGLVLEDDSHGPQLCAGVIALSYPPQCGGPDLVGWSWDAAPGVEVAGAARMAQVAVRGVWVDEALVLTRPPTPQDEAAAGTGYAGQAPTPASPAAQEVADELDGSDPALLLVMPEGEEVVVDVVIDPAGALQREMDARFGAGRVRIVPVLDAVE